GGQRARWRAPDPPATPAGVGDATLMRGAASRTLAVLAAAVAIGTTLVYAQVSDVRPIERVTLRSGSYTDFRQVFTREVPAGVAEAFAALHFLAGHPRIDADRIGIDGFSFGGEVAHLTAFEVLRAVMAPGSSRFAAHVATYPGGSYGARPDAGAYTGAPILMLLGEQDDNLPVAKVEGYLAYASGAGHPAPITTVVYPGAFHAWAVPTPGALRFYAQFVST